MDRNEAKVLMRQELEEQTETEFRDQKVFPVGERMLSANDLMAEVDGGTELGNFLLDDFIAFKSGKINENDPTVTERAHAISMMEDDLKSAPAGWADQVIVNEEGRSWTPNQIMKEVRDGTEFGNRYVVIYLANHKMLERLLGEGYDKVLDATNIGDLMGVGSSLTNMFDLPSITKKKSDDQAN